MRISDWSSDVCSSDLSGGSADSPAPSNRAYQSSSSIARVSSGSNPGAPTKASMWPCSACATSGGSPTACAATMDRHTTASALHANERMPQLDRKSVVYGKQVSVRVAHGGHRYNKKKNMTDEEQKK